MYLTGFTDEAGAGLEAQIKATQALGWSNIECRKVGVDGHETANLHDISDEAFEIVASRLEETGIRINCFGSAIANWGKYIDQLESEDGSMAEVERAIPRMKRLGSPLVRLMSYAVIKTNGPEEQMFEERVRRLNKIVPMFVDAGLTPVHENCMNYGGMGEKYTLELLAAVPGLKLVFDTGNPVFTDDRSYAKPYPKQDPWKFYQAVKEHIAYLHIKDGVWDYGEEKVKYTWPGEGSGDVRAIVKDLLDSGYQGGISMEPHMQVVAHEDDSAEVKADLQFKGYVEYGQRFESLLADLGYPYKDPSA
jgi:sugar phosphate isomerase/epimerase